LPIGFSIETKYTNDIDVAVLQLTWRHAFTGAIRYNPESDGRFKSVLAHVAVDMPKALVCRIDDGEVADSTLW
jgi:hypothetical protein